MDYPRLVNLKFGLLAGGTLCYGMEAFLLTIGSKIILMLNTCLCVCVANLTTIVADEASIIVAEHEDEMSEEDMADQASNWLCLCGSDNKSNDHTCDECGQLRVMEDDVRA